MTAKKEIEIKLRLSSLEDYNKVRSFLGSPRSIENQINYYLDNHKDEFIKTKSTFRMRIVNGKEAYITYKGKNQMIDGVSVSQEMEAAETIETVLACIEDRKNFITLNILNNVFRHVLNLYKNDPSEIKIIGHITTMRTIYEWNGHKLELDDSDYGFDKNYEIEIETGQPEIIKPALEEMLKKIGVSYNNSKANKFTNFVSGKIIV